MMLKKLKIKREPVESLEQVHTDMTDNLEGMTTAVKTEEESKDFENDWSGTSLPTTLLVASLARAREHRDGEELGSARIASSSRRASMVALAILAWDFLSLMIAVQYDLVWVMYCDGGGGWGVDVLFL